MAIIIKKTARYNIRYPSPVNLRYKYSTIWKRISKSCSQTGNKKKSILHRMDNRVKWKKAF